MAIARFYEKDGVIRRLSVVSGHRKQFQSTATVEGCFQEMDRRARERIGIIEERAWWWWCDLEADINEGDTIMIDNKEYKVFEVTKKDYGANVHKQCLLEEVNE